MAERPSVLQYIFIEEDRAPNIVQIFWEIAKSMFNGSDDFPEESKHKKLQGSTVIVDFTQPRVYK